MEKRSGLILGKFMPLHKGHLYLIESALEKVNKLTILCCTLDSESINGVLRWNWLKEEIEDKYPNKNIIIKHIYEDLPQEPKNADDFNFWSIWSNLIKRECSDIDLIISSEDYGDRLALDLGIDHYKVDKERINIPISATKIRNNIHVNFNWLSNSAKTYYGKRIVLIGPESTGKTTTINKLGSLLDLEVVPEFGRIWTDQYLTNNKLSESKFTINDIDIIGCNQLKLEEMGIKKSKNPYILCDTDIIATITWSYMYFNKCSNWLIEKSLDNKYKNDLYLLFYPDIDWVDDGTREFKDRREEHYNIILKELEKRKLNFEIINGVDRIENSIRKITKWINKL